MEEVSCNSGAEEFRVIGDTETSGQIFNQAKNNQNSLDDSILHQNTGGWTAGPPRGQCMVARRPVPHQATLLTSQWGTTLSQDFTLVHTPDMRCAMARKGFIQERQTCV